MSKPVLDAATRKRVVEQLAWTLKTFHEANEKKPDGFEAVSWRNQLGGFRRALGLIVGDQATSEILETVRQLTKLGFPHGGPVMNDGEIFGIDSEASPRL